MEILLPIKSNNSNAKGEGNLSLSLDLMTVKIKFNNQEVRVNAMDLFRAVELITYPMIKR